MSDRAEGRARPLHIAVSVSWSAEPEIVFSGPDSFGNFLALQIPNNLPVIQASDLL
jgi:hypothetical protein